MFQRKSKKIKPMLELYSILFVFTAASNSVAWPYSLVPSIANYYVVAFLFSLHYKFDEEEKKNAAQEAIRSVTVSQPLVNNGCPSEPNPNDPAIVNINPNTFACYNLRPAPDAPPSYGAKF